MTTLTELKAQAYDAISQIETWKQILANINQKIANWKEPEEAKDTEEENAPTE